MEEAKLRDHRTIGQKLDLFSVSSALSSELVLNLKVALHLIMTKYKHEPVVSAYCLTAISSLTFLVLVASDPRRCRGRACVLASQGSSYPAPGGGLLERGTRQGMLGF